MAAFNSEETKTVLDENETLLASPILQKLISSSSAKVVVKRQRVSQQLRPSYSVAYPVIWKSKLDQIAIMHFARCILWKLTFLTEVLEKFS